VRAIREISWLALILAVIFLLMTIPNHDTTTLSLLFVLVILSGINLYHVELYRKKMRRVGEIMASIDFKPLELELKKIEDKQEELSRKISHFENELEAHKVEEEKKYRDVVRKVLEMDNKFTKKFNLMGEAVVKLSKDIKKD
jgi:hypothetical protein